MTGASTPKTAAHPVAPRRAHSLKAKVTQLEEKCARLERQRNGLLDIVNAACVDQGGALVIREASWTAARRHDLEWLLRPGAVVIRPIGGAHSLTDPLQSTGFGPKTALPADLAPATVSVAGSGAPGPFSAGMESAPPGSESEGARVLRLVKG